jgi:hypothetical protein
LENVISDFWLWLMARAEIWGHSDSFSLRGGVGKRKETNPGLGKYYPIAIYPAPMDLL